MDDDFTPSLWSAVMDLGIECAHARDAGLPEPIAVRFYRHNGEWSADVQTTPDAFDAWCELLSDGSSESRVDHYEGNEHHRRIFGSVTVLTVRAGETS